MKESKEERMEKENHLFDERNWQNYIKLLKEIYKLIEAENVLCLMGGSARDSYFLNQGVLGNERCKNVLFNDALKATFEIVGLDEQFIQENLMKLDRVLETALKGCELFYAQRLLSDSSEVLVISNELIAPEDLDVIVCEKRESTDEEKEILMKYLIIRVSTRVGL